MDNEAEILLKILFAATGLLHLPHQLKKMQNLFTEFPPVSKAEWLEKIKKDLKGKAPSDFDWQVAEGQSVSAFPHLDDLGGSLPHPISEGRNDWQICEDIHVGNDEEANKMALRALEGGAEALRFVLTREPDFGVLLAGVDLSIVSTHFLVKKTGTIQDQHEIVNLLRNFVAHVDTNAFDAAKINGTLNSSVSPTSADELLRFALQHLPSFKVLPVNGADFFQTEDKTAEELTQINNEIYYWLATLATSGFSAMDICRNLHFTVAIGKNYFLQIAKLRALRQRWAFIQQNAGVTNPQPAFICAFLPLSQQSPDANTNLIQATTQAMSAVIGGVDVLTVLPSDITGEETMPTDFSLRMARNVQHILKMESHFDWVADPAAGSYFIENLTEKLLEGMRDEG